MQIGDVVNMTHWTHFQPDIQVSYKAPRGRVGVFLMLGYADKKSPGSFNPVEAINYLGWFPKSSSASSNEKCSYDEEKELALCRAHWESVGSGTPFPDLWEGWKACAKARSHE
jgi:hypothetical protein